MHSTASLLTSVLPALIEKAPLTPDKVAFAWRTVAGDAVARWTRVTLVDGVLHVTSDDGRWLREIERARDTLLPRLRQLLGRDAVRVIKTGSGR
jgi:predicted nucleic acid-binding Zn ribbon protein